jgi:hypothetical protein
MRLHKVIALAVSLGLPQCSASETGTSSGTEESIAKKANVGAPCIPTNEIDPQFAGFKINEETIVTGAPGCGIGVCLVNHFQGRVSCPMGQASPQPCSGPQDAACGADGQCVEADTLSPSCDPDSSDKGSSACAGYGGICSAATRSCVCSQTADCPTGAYCDAETKQCKIYVCHKGAGDCQVSGDDNAINQDKACCVPGTQTPVAAAVCGQCGADSNRDAERAVYCSCRCGVAEGEPEDPEFDFCDCPAGFACEEIRKNFGLGDPNLTGKYCIKQGSQFVSEQHCGQVEGYFSSSQCKGIHSLD